MVFKRKLYFTQIEAIKMDGYIQSMVHNTLIHYHYLIILQDLILFLKLDEKGELTTDRGIFNDSGTKT